MRDPKRNLRVLTAHESPPSGSAGVPVPPPAATLSLAGFNALPLSVRASEHLADMLLALEAIETDLSKDEAAGLRWIAPTIREVGATVSDALKLLAS